MLQKTLYTANAIDKLDFLKKSKNRFQKQYLARVGQQGHQDFHRLLGSGGALQAEPEQREVIKYLVLVFPLMHTIGIRARNSTEIEPLG